MELNVERTLGNLDLNGANVLLSTISLPKKKIIQIRLNVKSPQN